MSLPALISKLSGRTPRFVTVSGRVVSGAEVVATSDGHHHPDHGYVTPIRRHTNHGGSASPETHVSPWWEAAPDQLELEKVAMGKAFPGFAFDEIGGRPAWRGKVNTGRGTFEITIVHRPDHRTPRVVPTTRSLLRRQEGRHQRWSSHLYLNGDLCVAEDADWNPARDDAVTVVAWAAHWLASFTEWRISGRGWPAEGVSVDVFQHE